MVKSNDPEHSYLVNNESELHFSDTSLMLSKIKYRLKDYMEMNRRDNVRRKSCWQQRMQDIYIFFYQHRKDDSDHKRPPMWQQYTEKE